MEEPRTTSAPPRRGHGGPMGMARGGEKAKDLIGTWKKLLGYCRRYRVALVVALLCAVLGTVLTLAGPDQLSDMTDTITAGIATGQSRPFAMKYSLLMSIPAVLGANLLSLIKALKAGVEWSNFPAYLIGMIVSIVVGYFSIILLQRLLKKGKFGNFAYYMWGVGVVTLIASLF